MVIHTYNNFTDKFSHTSVQNEHVSVNNERKLDTLKYFDNFWVHMYGTA